MIPPAEPRFPDANVQGAPWNLDWRDRSPVVPGFIGFGDQTGALSVGNPTDWNPYTGPISTHPLIFGYSDPAGVQTYGIGDRLEAGSYIPWPLSGTEGVNNQVPLLELAEESGLDLGQQLWTGPGPRMVFLPPPSYSDQTTPLATIGI